MTRRSHWRFTRIPLKACLLLILATGCLQTKFPPACPDLITSPAQLAHLQPLCPDSSQVREADTPPWRIEAYLGNQFARRLTWDEALRCYRRAQLLAPPGENKGITQQLAYNLVLCEFFANRPAHAISAFETSELTQVERAFPFYGDLLVVLSDSYARGTPKTRDQARLTLGLLAEIDPQRAALVSLRSLVQARDLSGLEARADFDEALSHLRPLMHSVRARSCDPKRAMGLNALLPGAGYWYVGQRQTALTSLALNILFGAAAWRSLHKGDTALGLIALSFELGWYFGGIQGVKLAAEEYNRRQFDPIGDKILQEGGARKAQLIKFGF